jgi:DNA-3-methyladenine glycosylase
VSRPSAEHVTGGERLPRSFFARPSTELAPLLLNKVLVHGDRSARIVEVEAYGGADDPASHAYRGPTRRNAVMFGPPGHLYVYFTYGMHWCANAVCGEAGDGVAVLLRAGEPLAGIADMWADRPAARRPRDLANGPAKLCQALGIDGGLDGADLAAAPGIVAIVDDGVAPPGRPGRSRRIGISVAIDRPWRWYVPDDPHVSRAPGSRSGPRSRPKRSGA